jgi:antirestriction protein ArdC
MQDAIYQKINDMILAMLQNGEIPWKKNWSISVKSPHNASTKHQFRGSNFWLTVASRFRHPGWLTFEQCKKLGGYVQKGEKSTPIVFAGYQTKEEDGQTRNWFTFRVYPEFNVEQCANLPESIRKLEFEKINFTLESAENLIAEMPNKPVIKFDTRTASYNPATDEIHMPPISDFNSAEEFYSTLFHELAHSVDLKRLDKPSVYEEHLQGEAYSKGELIAELTSAKLCSMVGINNTLENSASYINCWLKKLQHNTKFFYEAASRADKVVEYVMNQKTLAA